MDYDGLIDEAKKIAGTNDDNDDFLVDRLHSRYTVAGLMCFTIVISTYQYLGRSRDFLASGTRVLFAHRRYNPLLGSCPIERQLR